MTEEDSKVMKLLHNKEKVSNKVLENNVQDVTHFMGTPAFDIVQAEMDKEVERRRQQQKVEAAKEIFTASDPDEVITTTFTDEELQKYVEDKIEKELRSITPEQLFNLGIVALGGDNTPTAEFEKLSKNKNYEVLKVNDGKFFITVYRPINSNTEVIVVKLPPKQN